MNPNLPIFVAVAGIAVGWCLGHLAQQPKLVTEAFYEGYEQRRIDEREELDRWVRDFCGDVSVDVAMSDLDEATTMEMLRTIEQLRALPEVES